MDIKDAKDQIKNAITAYFSKDEFGNYMIPLERQRPIFLMGAPGIGKTAVMEQIAQELNVGLVSYSMTHHTRQSALGLPFIVKKVYDGKEYDVSEYTMSEIIASIYDMMEETGIKEGILFLDEINCVSETLAPAMLQFLQFKIFGRHRIPDGWIVVTAGNPPEYNKSVREFDIVTWDRLKRIDVEPNFEAWKEYAYKKNVHASVLTYLEIKKNDFYKVETTVEGKSFVTARGWDDLSQMIYLYEKHGIKVDNKLIGQYLQNRKIAKDFSIYYDLFNKYKSDYQVESILSGNVKDEIKKRAALAKFDERLSLLGLILDAITNELKDVIQMEAMITELLKILKIIKLELSNGEESPIQIIERHISNEQTILANGKKNGTLSEEARIIKNKIISVLEDQKQKFISSKDKLNQDKAFKMIKGHFDSTVLSLKEESEKAGVHLNNVFVFAEEAFEDKQELLILVTELTINYYSSKFIARYGCEKYFEHNKDLLFYERQQEITYKLEDLDL
ncbi:MAG: AAA family ATPase [Lachnospiraceae bacterium]|nr:AAA family ATPase [Lachnospiraceae bacterium]